MNAVPINVLLCFWIFSSVVSATGSDLDKKIQNYELERPGLNSDRAAVLEKLDDIEQTLASEKGLRQDARLEAHRLLMAGYTAVGAFGKAIKNNEFLVESEVGAEKAFDLINLANLVFVESGGIPSKLSESRVLEVYASAFSEIEKIARNNPTIVSDRRYVDFIYSYARLLESRGHFDGAFTVYERLFSLAPDQLSILGQRTIVFGLYCYFKTAMEKKGLSEAQISGLIRSVDGPEKVSVPGASAELVASLKGLSAGRNFNDIVEALEKARVLDVNQLISLKISRAQRLNAAGKTSEAANEAEDVLTRLRSAEKSESYKNLDDAKKELLGLARALALESRDRKLPEAISDSLPEELEGGK